AYCVFFFFFQAEDGIRDFHVTGVQTCALPISQLARSLRRERVLALLSTLFGGVALALTVLGLYGVMAYTVARRRSEIGVRIALGADAPRVVRMVLRDAARVVVIGVMLGAAGAWIAGRLVRSFLYGLEPTEP